jgi:hypothetical protein
MRRGDGWRLLLWAILAMGAAVACFMRVQSDVQELTPLVPAAPDSAVTDTVPPRIILPDGHCDPQEYECAKRRVWRA